MQDKGFAVKLDKKFVGLITKVKDGTVVPEDEYVVFLAKDTAFANVLPHYFDVCVKLGCDEEQMKAVTNLMGNVLLWRSAHPEKCKAPDAAGEKILD